MIYQASVFLLVAVVLYLLITVVVNSIPTVRNRQGWPKRTTLLIVGTVSISISVVVLKAYADTSTASNDKTAYISREGVNYVVCIAGNRSAMVHDPISAMKNDTIRDSSKYVLPRDSGVIKGNELLIDKQKFISPSGQIVISHGFITIDLFYDQEGYPKPFPDTWNGKYELRSR